MNLSQMVKLKKNLVKYNNSTKFSTNSIQLSNVLTFAKAPVKV